MSIRPSVRARATATLLASLLGSALLAAPSPAAAGESKLAVIDLRRALSETEDGLRVKGKLQELLDTRQNEYEAKEKDYAKAKEEFDRLVASGRAPDSDLRKKATTLEKQAIDLQNQGMVIRQEMTKRENEMMAPIIDKVGRLLRQLASQEGYDVVVSREAVPYFRGDLEITDRVIQAYNQQNPAGDKKDGRKDSKAPAAPKAGAPAPSPEAPAKKK